MNRYVECLGTLDQSLLEIGLRVLTVEFERCFDLLNEEANGKEWSDGDPWWQQALVVLHLLHVVQDCVGKAAASIDTAQLPDNWSAVFKS